MLNDSQIQTINHSASTLAVALDTDLFQILDILVINGLLTNDESLEIATTIPDPFDT